MTKFRPSAKHHNGGAPTSFWSIVRRLGTTMVLPASPSRSKRRIGGRSGIAAAAAASLLLIVVSTMTKLRGGTLPRWVGLKKNRDPEAFRLDRQEKVEFVSMMKRIKKKPFGVGTKIKMSDLPLSRPEPSEYDDYGALDPLWTCRDENAINGRSKKVVFVHALDVAEASIYRAILEAYSHHCHAGLAVVSYCSSLTVRSMQRGNWTNGKGYRAGTPCRLRKVIQRNLDESIDIEYFNTTFLKRNVDILSGQVPLGVDAFWTDAKGTPVGVQYVTFFQDPVRMYVNRAVDRVRDKDVTFNETIESIKEHVRSEHKYGRYFSQYSSFLITPQQAEDLNKAGIVPSHQSAVYMAMQNLLANNALVGIAERVSPSIKLLKHIVDRTTYLDRMFEYFGMKNATGFGRKAVDNPYVKFVKELEQDLEFMKVMREYLKFDDEIYKFAVELHKRQFNWYKKQERKVTG